MSLHAPVIYCILDDTTPVAKAAFPKANPYLRMRDERGPLFTNPEVAALFARDAPPAYAPAHLALVTLMPCAAGLSDRHAAAAVRRRSDWKYALALPLAAAGFDAAILAYFAVACLWATLNCSSSMPC